jgi:hypothetical protein
MQEHTEQLRNDHGNTSKQLGQAEQMIDNQNDVIAKNEELVARLH